MKTVTLTIQMQDTVAADLHTFFLAQLKATATLAGDVATGAKSITLGQQIKVDPGDVLAIDGDVVAVSADYVSGSEIPLASPPIADHKAGAVVGVLKYATPYDAALEVLAQWAHGVSGQLLAQGKSTAFGGTIEGTME